MHAPSKLHPRRKTSSPKCADSWAVEFNPVAGICAPKLIRKPSVTILVVNQLRPEALSLEQQYGVLGAKLPTAHFKRDIFGMVKTEPSTRNQSTIIHDAIQGRDKADIHESIFKQPDALKKADGFGNAPLHLAVMLRDARAVKALLDCGANVNQTNSQTYETPLHLF